MTRPPTWGNSFTQWMKEREIGLEDIKGRTDDLQAAPVFPVTTSIEELGILIRWMTAEPQLKEGKELWLRAEKLSADEISAPSEPGTSLRTAQRFPQG